MNAQAFLLARDADFAATYPGGIVVEKEWKGAMEQAAPFEPTN